MAAITFTRNAVGNLSGVKAVAGLNDNWIQFNGQSDALSAEIVITNNDTTEEKTFVISPDGSATPQFYFNLKEAVRSFFPIAIDDFDYSGDVTDPVKLWQDLTIDITITHSVSANDTGSISAYFLKSKRQPPESIFVTSEQYLSKNLVKFTGYPYEVFNLGGNRIFLADSSNDLVRCYEWNDLSWYQVGNALSISTTGLFSLAALSSTRVVVIESTGDAIQAYDFDGTNFTAKGSPLTITGTTNPPAICALDHESIAYVDSNNDELRKYTFDGSGWSLVGSGLSIVTTGQQSICALSKSRVVVADSTLDTIQAYSFNGSVWSTLGNSLAIANIGNPVAITALTSTRIALIDSFNDELRAYSFNGTNWTLTGSGLSITNTLSPALAAMSENELAFIDQTNDSLRFYSFSGTSWTNKGANLTVTVGTPALTSAKNKRTGFFTEQRDECGIYLKWLNWQGGYSYWLFERVYPETHQTRSEGEYLNNAIDEPNFPTFEIGKEIRISRQLKGTANDRATIELFQSLVRSNEVYLFTGEKGDAADETTWMTVTMRDGSFKFTNKRDTMEMSFTIDLPTV